MLRNANLRLDTHKWLLTIKKTFFKNEMSLVHLTKFDIFFIFLFGFIYDFSLQGSRASNEITVSVFNWMTWSSDDCYKKNSTLLKFNSFHVHVVTPLILSVDTYFHFYAYVCSFSSRIVLFINYFDLVYIMPSKSSSSGLVEFINVEQLLKSFWFWFCF